MSAEHLLTLCTFATFSMFGVIWIIQLIHYPAYRYIDVNEFQKYQKLHQNRISVLVLPLMLIELISSIYLFMLQFESLFYILNLATVLLLWLLTFSIFVPLHGKLQADHSPKKITTLIRMNWVRTILWSLRATLLLFYPL